MNYLVKLLSGSLGPYIVGAVAVIAALLTVQTVRLDHAKGELQASRAALKNPATGKTWQSEATSAARDLGTCRANHAEAAATLEAQSQRAKADAAETARRLTMLQDALQTARRESSAHASRSARILAIEPKGADVCARYVDVDRQIAEVGR